MLEGGREKEIARDRPDPVIFPVTLQQGFTEGKKRVVGEAIVLQDNPFLLLVEKPGNRLADRSPATEVLLPVKPVYFARPVNLLGDGPGLTAQIVFPQAIVSRTVSRYIQFPGLLTTKSLKYACRNFRTIENQKQHWSSEGHKRMKL
jgi:hypothetical protein